ncbi:MAG: ICP22 family protein [Desulfobulbaceae bacterium]
MKTSQNNPDKPGMDEVDDLTRFLDEDFGTEDVDLFEFTSEQDSPLTQLKSIILSLDWEISDETLQDLTDEISHLKHLEQFASDKVSQVYLQGLDKIGHYIQAEGAYCHPNSIKLLLTLYYDFEKILSSEHITGAEITALLKADVRKFKILQHQIAQKHGATAAATEEVSAPLPLTEHKDLQGVQAAILELDWEVTDKGLANLTNQLNILRERYTEDRFIQVVIQGLHSLNTYIIEERGRAHPETFSLLHNFYDALESLVEKPDLEEEKRQEILIDSVNRLNNLKHLIAQTYPQEVVAAEAISPVAEPGEPAAVAAAEEVSAPEAPPEATLPPEPVFPPQARKIPAPAAEEDLDEIAIFGTDMDEHREIAPALSDSMEEPGFAMAGAAETPSEELAEKLDFFFGEEKEKFEPETIEKEMARKAEEKLPVEPAAPVVFEEEIAPALAGSFEEQGFGAEGEGLQAPSSELADKLDFFFGEEAKKPAEEEATPVTAPAVPEEEEPALTFAVEPEGALAEFEADEIAPALADQGEDVGFGGRGAHLEAPPDELAEKLDFFFGPDEEKGMVPKVEASAQAPAEEPAITFAAEPEGEAGIAFTAEEEEKGAAVAFTAEPAEEISPALADFGEEAGFTGKEMEAQPEGLAEKLDFFFGAEEQAPAAEMKATPAAEPEEEEFLLTPALAAAAEEEIPVYEEVATPAEYQAALRQMRSEFKEMETTLKAQIEGLRRDIQSLQAQLKP